MRRPQLAVVAISLAAGACSGGDSAVPLSSAIAPTSTSSPASALAKPGDIVVLESTIEVPAASAFGDPGFHETFVLTGAVPEAAAEQSGDLVVRLRDLDDPNRACDRDHPLSGCATIDWSDFEDRPRVPAGGVFDNHLNVVSTSGDVMLFLSEDRGLATAPDQYSPT